MLQTVPLRLTFLSKPIPFCLFRNAPSWLIKDTMSNRYTTQFATFTMANALFPLTDATPRILKSFLLVIQSVKPVWLCARTENSPIEDVPDKNTVVHLNVQNAANVHVIIAIGITVKRTAAAQNTLRFLMTIDCL